MKSLLAVLSAAAAVSLVSVAVVEGVLAVSRNPAPVTVPQRLPGPETVTLPGETRTETTTHTETVVGTEAGQTVTETRTETATETTTETVSVPVQPVTRTTTVTTTITVPGWP